MPPEITQIVPVNSQGKPVSKQLGQLRPSDNTAASLYSPATGVRAIVDTIMVVNTTDAAVKYRIFHDDNGTTYNEVTTILGFDISFVARGVDILRDLNLGMFDSTGNLAVRTDTGNALNFTAYGREFDNT